MDKDRMDVVCAWWDSTGRHQARIIPEIATQHRRFSSDGVHDVAVFTKNVHYAFLFRSGILNGIEWRYLSDGEKHSVMAEWYEVLAEKH